MKTYIIFLLSICFLTGCKTIHNCDQSENIEGSATIEKSRYPDKSLIRGTFADAESGEPIYSGEVFLYNSDHYYGVLCDENGNFEIKGIEFGIYTIEFSSSIGGYEKITMNIDLEVGYKVDMDVKLKEFIIELEKPVIYIYPEKDTMVHVQLNYQGELLHTYPSYPDSGWMVKAQSNGTLWDQKGQEYYALFWEGTPDKELLPSDGFVVSGKETATFLEEQLAFLGLNRREANEFIMYWLPRMEGNAYNFIHFASDKYNEMAQLKINPEPETLIRVMMLTKSLKQKIEVPVQDLAPLRRERKGFTVVEWGGSIINDLPF
jgi:hypothetical protein